MTPEDYQWSVKLVQDRYRNLNLTYEQAEQVYKYELDRDTFSETAFFSAWEAWDHEITAFREILNNEQLKTYETILKENIQRHEQSLVEKDKEKTNVIAYNQELVNFYETQFLPDFFKDPMLLRLSWTSSDRAKVSYLRTEYKLFLDNTKKAILTNHFRHYRAFKPNELKASLLRHKLSYILPDYISFKQQMDEPTKAVVQYLKIKLPYLPCEAEKMLTRKLSELKAFNEANSKKFYGEISSWHVAARQLTAEEQREDHFMTLVLLDNKKYGC